MQTTYILIHKCLNCESVLSSHVTKASLKKAIKKELKLVGDHFIHDMIVKTYINNSCMSDRSERAINFL